MGDFKVKCVKASSNCFVVGNTYEVINGNLKYEGGKDFNIGGGYGSVEKINNSLASQFKLVKDKPSFKVRCTKTIGDMLFTRGEVYQVIDGTLRDNQGHEYSGYNNAQQINEDLSSQFKLVDETEPKPFTKADLRTGMRAKYRDGDIRVVLLGTANDSDVLIGNTWGRLNAYDENLICKNKQYCHTDIVTVFEQPFVPTELLDISKYGKILYQRIEPTYITIDEAEAMLTEAEGKEIKIRKERGYEEI